ncbi:MAG: cytochrome ubiquinol oxidase subunit I [Kiritimatiellales bacterium]|nr:cytochrome ubiquinol oxidase subunit I [Kiritimatiellales bacterium]MCF7863494.1 cytochrome ubiquinol oxidase subunit I [Kiritimatiellales bacterium]
MDVVLLARIQFGLTIGFHYVFPPLTIGLAWMIFLYNTRYQENDNPVFLQLARFWTRIFAISFVVGVATGITMEFQFGTNWAGYSRFVGDIFGAPLAAEGVFAFFLESSFLGILLYGRKKVSPRMYWFSSLMVALGATMSAFWIVVANSWQQTPAGYKVATEMVNGVPVAKAVLTNFWEAVFNPSTLPRYFHVITAALCVGVFFILGTSAWQILKGRHKDFAMRSMRSVIVPTFGVVLLTMFVGHHHGFQVSQTQPAKLAAFEGLWETQTHAPMMLFGLPDQKNEKNDFAITIPGMVSLFIGGKFDTEVQGLKAFAPEDRPPVAASFWSFHLMFYIGMWMALVSFVGVVLWLMKKLGEHKAYLWAAALTVPLPFLANEFGWIAAEVGRQPWVVYGELRTADAISASVPGGQVLASIIMFSLIYSLLFGLWIYLLKRQFHKGPEPLEGEVA